MPKMKSHRGAAKRFELTGSGKIKRRHANLNHILEKKASKRKRRLGNSAIVADADTKRIKRLLGK